MKFYVWVTPCDGEVMLATHEKEIGVSEFSDFCIALNRFVKDNKLDLGIGSEISVERIA